MAEGKTNMFGKTYNTIGSTDSNFIIKTKGDLKILWGNKYIDLLKGGKIATTTKDNIFKNIDSSDNIIEDGIYLVGEELWISIEGKKFNVSMEELSEGSTFVSFTIDLDCSLEQKHTALSNIGLYYNRLDDIKRLSSGIAYVEETGKLYTINKGIITPCGEHTSDSLVVSNQFEELTVGPLHLYSLDGFGIVDSSVSMQLSVLGIPYITLEDETIKTQGSLLIDNEKKIYSEGATSEYGYQIYMENGESTLAIDNIIWRNHPIPLTYELLINKIENKKLAPKMYYLITDFLNPWEVTWKDEFLCYEDQYTLYNNGSYLTLARNAMLIIVQASSINTINKLVWAPLHPDWIIYYNPYYQTGNQLRLRILEDGSIKYLPFKGIITYLKDEFGNEGNFNFRQHLFKREDTWRYCMDHFEDVLGSFNAGENNKFIFDSIESYILLPKFNIIVDDNNNVTSYQTEFIDSDILISEGINFVIKSNNLIVNNYFKSNSLSYITIDTDILQNNKFSGFLELDIKGTITNNNINDVEKLYLKGIVQDNIITTEVPINVNYIDGIFVGNTLHNVKKLFNTDLSIGKFSNNTIKNSTIQYTADENSIFVDNIINKCDLSIISYNNINDNSIEESIIIIDNLGIILLNKFINLEDGNINNIINSTLTNNNFFKVKNIVNLKNISSNNIENANKIFNSGTLINNIINKSEIINNKGLFSDNIIKSANSIYIDPNTEFTTNVINNITNTTIENGVLIDNNTIHNIENCVILGNLCNNLFNIVKNTTFNSALDNISYGTIDSCAFSMSFSDNVINRTIKNLNSTGDIVSCTFDKSVENFTVQSLLDCTLGRIKDLTLNEYPINNTIFRGSIDNPTRTLTDYEWELLKTSDVAKEVFPNIRVVSVSEIVRKGMIIMWYGKEDIPRGWAICNGENGTPNLIDKFIKASNTVGSVGEGGGHGEHPENNEFTLEEKHLPAHSHPHEAHIHTLSGIVGESGYSEVSVTGVSVRYDSNQSGTAIASLVDEDIEIGSYIDVKGYTSYNPTFTGGSHNHTIIISGGIADPAISKEEDSEKKATAIKIEPWHFRLIFIMKIDTNPE